MKRMKHAVPSDTGETSNLACAAISASHFSFGHSYCKQWNHLQLSTYWAADYRDCRSLALADGRK
ncbi:MAG: hypothetical protein ACXWCS_26310 [Burkholderiales bacterium]